MYRIVDRVIKNLKREDFIFSKNYQIKAIYDYPRGKWSNLATDSVFVDSKKFFSIYARKFFDRIIEILHRELYLYDIPEDGGINVQEFLFAQTFLNSIHYMIDTTDSKEFALTAILKAESSMRNYYDDMNWGENVANMLFSNQDIRLRFENQYKIVAPISVFLKSLGPVHTIIQNFLMMILLCMMGLAYVVANSLITNQIEDKTYENAMLRCLGWTKSSIVLVTIIKTTLFFIIPGYVSAIGLSYLFVGMTRDLIEQSSRRDIILDYGWTPYVMGIFVAYCLPLISMISPVINGLSVQLRDALDVFRKKVETMDIQFKKLQNMYGLSVIQMVMGILLSTYGVLVYIQVPQALINNNMSIALTYLMLMYLTCSMASCLLVKYFIPVV